MILHKTFYITHGTSYHVEVCCQNKDFDYMPKVFQYLNVYFMKENKCLF